MKVKTVFPKIKNIIKKRSTAVLIYDLQEQLFQKILSEYYQRVKQFGFRSGLTFCQP